MLLPLSCTDWLYVVLWGFTFFLSLTSDMIMSCVCVCVCALELQACVFLSDFHLKQIYLMLIHVLHMGLGVSWLECLKQIYVMLIHVFHRGL